MTIEQSVTITTSPEKIYEALTSAAVFSEVTGAPAEIDATEGGSLSCFDGQITGRNLELAANQRIVQEWRAAPWPDGVYSTVEFNIKAAGNSVLVEMKQSGYPEGSAEHLEGGWHKMYWEPLKAYFS